MNGSLALWRDTEADKPNNIHIGILINFLNEKITITCDENKILSKKN